MIIFVRQLLLFCILVTQSLYIAIIRFEPATTYKFAIPIFVSLIAFFCAPIQGGLSDYHCRKKSLLFALIINLISSVFFLFWISQKNILYLIIYMVMIGAAGNVNPIAIAAYKDVAKQFINFRFFVALSLFYYFVGDFSHIISIIFTHKSALMEISYVLLVLCIILIFLLYKDTKDITINPNEAKNRLSILHEIKYIYHNFLKHKYFIFALLGYFFLELSIYQFTFRNEAFKNFLTQLVPVEMIIGAFLGSIFLKFVKISDEKTFISSLSFVLISFLALLFLKIFELSNEKLLIFIITILGASYTVVYSSVYCLLTRKRHHHDHGKIFGMLESTDSISYLAAITVVAFLFKIAIQKVWLISLSLFVIAIIFFMFFLRHDKSITNQS